MMVYSEDHIALAAEYALGTLDADERAQVQAMMSVDADFTSMVVAWERRLGVLNQMVGSVEPRAEVWERIRTEIGLTAAQPKDPDPAASGSAEFDFPDGPLHAAQTPPLEAGPAPHLAPPLRVDAGSPSEAVDIVAFNRQLRRWRGIAGAASALAAVLVAMIVVQSYRPDLLPAGLRPAMPPRQVAQIVQVAPASQAPAPQAQAAQYVALLQKDGVSPAFILTVDAGTKTFTVRKVDVATAPGQSYELWLVSDKLQRPRSLGVIGGDDFTIRPSLAAYDSEMVNKATYAVTVEPEGGSPSGVATGPIVFTGKLIETVPSASNSAAAPRNSAR